MTPDDIRLLFRAHWQGTEAELEHALEQFYRDLESSFRLALHGRWPLSGKRGDELRAEVFDAVESYFANQYLVYTSYPTDGIPLRYEATGGDAICDSDDFEQLRDLYCGRLTYENDRVWLDNVDTMFAQMCALVGLDFAPQADAKREAGR